jgi:NAD(P)-dependent dehydrogenase (short-subunit alcohol dehydrogenase family)
MRALITGCSTGIGRASAVELTKRGYEVVATARRLESIADLDVSARVQLDVDLEESVAAARAAAGPIDVLVNNAGFGVDGAVETVPLDDVRRMFETNFFGAARVIQAFLPGMRERGRGAIVNVSSAVAIAASPLGGYYAASKYALEALSEALHLEAGHFGIRVVVIEPGRIESNFGANLIDYREKPGPYRELADIWQGALEKLRAGNDVPGCDCVAQTIADAIESDEYHLRWPVGQDAQMISAARNPVTYDEFEATMRAFLQVDW